MQPGEEFSALWGSGYDKARAFIEIEHRRKIVLGYWTNAGNTQQRIQQAVTEAMRGGFTLRVTMVRENRLYSTEQHVDVPWSNKNLTVKWEHFVSKLEPGQKETYTAIITGPDAKRAVGEMVASLYDESLDQFLPHHWMHRFDAFRQDYPYLRSRFESYGQQLQHLTGNWNRRSKGVEVSYRHYPSDLIDEWWANQMMHVPDMFNASTLRESADMDGAMPQNATRYLAKDAAPPKSAEEPNMGGGMVFNPQAPPGGGNGAPNP